MMYEIKSVNHRHIDDPIDDISDFSFDVEIRIGKYHYSVVLTGDIIYNTTVCMSDQYTPEHVECKEEIHINNYDIYDAIGMTKSIGGTPLTPTVLDMIAKEVYQKEI